MPPTVRVNLQYRFGYLSRKKLPHVFKLVVGKGMRLALIGTAIGLVASLALTRVMGLCYLS